MLTTTFCHTDVVLVAEVNSLEGLPHYAFQLTLRNPGKDTKRHINGLISCYRKRWTQKNSLVTFYLSQF